MPERVILKVLTCNPLIGHERLLHLVDQLVHKRVVQRLFVWVVQVEGVAAALCPGANLRDAYFLERLFGQQRQEAVRYVLPGLEYSQVIFVLHTGLQQNIGQLYCLC